MAGEMKRTSIRIKIPSTWFSLAERISCPIMLLIFSLRLERTNLRSSLYL